MIELSSPLPCFMADDPGRWDFVIDRARLLDQAGVDRLTVSDHVVFGERLEEYGRPELGGLAGDLLRAIVAGFRDAAGRAASA
jgi:hypothetical protein